MVRTVAQTASGQERTMNDLLQAIAADVVGKLPLDSVMDTLFKRIEEMEMELAAQPDETFLVRALEFIHAAIVYAANPTSYHAAVMAADQANGTDTRWESDIGSVLAALVLIYLTTVATAKFAGDPERGRIWSHVALRLRRAIGK
jgi:hypothetical protein